MTESLEAMMDRYGFPHTWDQYVRFINKWRLIAETIEVRIILDVAQRCPIEELAKMAKDKLENADIERIDREWPGLGCFEYDWKGITKAYMAKEARTGKRCKLGCGALLSHPALPFCDEHMKDEELVKAWNEL